MMLAAFSISIHPPLAGRDVACRSTAITSSQFQSTRPSRGETDERHGTPEGHRISIHPPLAGRDALNGSNLPLFIYFNPPAPRGARRPRNIPVQHYAQDFNPPAPRGARRSIPPGRRTRTDFNPPAPRGARLKWTIFRRRLRHFNPPAPRGARPPSMRDAHAIFRFQSTRPSRGETDLDAGRDVSIVDFNPPAPRGARHSWRSTRGLWSHFNPPAPRGARRTIFARGTSWHLFQSTRPSRGETRHPHQA